jgi:hypothetical protein
VRYYAEQIRPLFCLDPPGDGLMPATERGEMIFHPFGERPVRTLACSGRAAELSLPHCLHHHTVVSRQIDVDHDALVTEDQIAVTTLHSPDDRLPDYTH